MTLATILALTPPARRSSCSEALPATADSTFASLLNDRKGAGAKPTGTRTPAATDARTASTLPAAKAEVEKAREADDSDVESVLLAMLNLTPVAMAAADDKESPTLTERAGSDRSSASTTAGDAQALPLPPVTVVDDLSSSAAQTDNGLNALDATPVNTRETTLASPEEKGGCHGALPAHVSVAETASLTSSEAKAVQVDQPGDVMPLKRAASAFEVASAPLKEEISAGVEPPEARMQALHMPAFAAQQTRDDLFSVQAQNSGVLTETMGTPAWQQSLGQQLACFTRNGIQHAELRLHPEELGSLHISLQLKNEQAQLHFVSASHQVRAALEAAVPHLRTSLAEAGIELGQSSVGAESSSCWQHSGDPSSHARPHVASQIAQDERGLPEEPIENVTRTLICNNGINTFA